MHRSDMHSDLAAMSKKLAEHDCDRMQTDLSVVFPDNGKSDGPLIDSASTPLPESWIWTDGLLSDSESLPHA